MEDWANRIVQSERLLGGMVNPYIQSHGART